MYLIYKMQYWLIILQLKQKSVLYTWDINICFINKIDLFYLFVYTGFKF